MNGLRTARGVIIVAATPDPDTLRGAYEVSHALAGNLRYLRRRMAAARTPDEPAPGPDTFDGVNVGAQIPDDLDLPVLVIAAEGATEVALPGGDRWFLGVIARSRPVPTCEIDVIGVFPPLPGDGPSDPQWLGKAADHIESRVDLWPLLQVAAPR
jgi:hypothetical protein